MAQTKEKKRRARRRQPRAGWGTQLAQLALNGPYKFQIDNGAAAAAREVPLESLPVEARVQPWPETPAVHAAAPPLALVVVFLRRLHRARLAPRPLGWTAIAALLRLSPSYARKLYRQGAAQFAAPPNPPRETRP